MSGYCENRMPGGQNVDCLKPPSPVKGIGVAPKGVSFAGMSDITNKITWKGKIQAGDTMNIYKVLQYEVRTTDPNIERSTSGQMEVTQIDPEAGTFYLDTGVCDYNELQAAFDGGDYDVYLFLQDGSIMHYEGEDSVLYGFTANITAGGKALPMPDGRVQSFPLFVNFEDREQFMRRKMVKPVWNPNSALRPYMPDGYSMTIKTPYDTGTGIVTVWVRKRCGAIVTGLETADFEALASNELDMTNVTITATDNTDGTYDLLIQKEAVPIDLEAGDYVIARVKKLTVAVVDALSNRLVVEAE